MEAATRPTSTPSKLAGGKKRKREEGSAAPSPSTPAGKIVPGTTHPAAAAAAAASSSPVSVASTSGAGSGTDEATARRIAKQARKDKKRDKASASSSASASAHTEPGSSQADDGIAAVNGPTTMKKKKSKSRLSVEHRADGGGGGGTAAAASSTSSLARGADRKGKATSAYCVVYPVLNMPIAPVWWKQPLGAVRELFDTMVMRYVPQLNGILIAHEDHTFLASSAELRTDSAFATAPVKVKCTVWSPSIGMRLEGKIVYSNTDVVSLLLNGTFNAAIPAAHLPPNEYEFVHHQYDASSSSAQGGDDDFGAQSPGYWRRKRDGAPLGDHAGRLTFTCFGITVANQLLFLRGSLLDDPTSVPAAASSSGLSADATGTSAVDARALQTLFPNVNLDFSSKDGYEAGQRRSAVRGSKGDGSGLAGGDGEGEGTARRRVRWVDQEDGEDEGEDGGAGADDDDAAHLSYAQPSRSSGSALPASDTSAIMEEEAGTSTGADESMRDARGDDDSDNDDQDDVVELSAPSNTSSQPAPTKQKEDKEARRKRKEDKERRRAEREAKRAAKEEKRAKKMAAVKKEAA